MVKKFKIMGIDDQVVCRLFLEKILHRHYPDAETIITNHLYSIFTTFLKFNPDVLILDYEYPGADLSEEEKVLDRLQKFEGLLLIHSIHPKEKIEKALSKRLTNFKVISKQDTRFLVNEINSYFLKIKEVDYGRV